MGDDSIPMSAELRELAQIALDIVPKRSRRKVVDRISELINVSSELDKFFIMDLQIAIRQGTSGKNMKSIRKKLSWAIQNRPSYTTVSTMTHGGSRTDTTF